MLCSTIEETCSKFFPYNSILSYLENISFGNDSNLSSLKKYTLEQLCIYSNEFNNTTSSEVFVLI